MIKSDSKNVCNGVPVSNNRDVLKWIVKEQTKSYKNNKKSLSSDLREELTGIFGRQNTTKTFTHRYKVWIIDYKGLQFNIFSASGKGTSVEICGYSYDEIRLGVKEKEIIEFLTELNNKI